MNATITRTAWIFITALFSTALADEPKIPGIMLPELTKITPQIVEKITATCPVEPALIKDRMEGWGSHVNRHGRGPLMRVKLHQARPAEKKDPSIARQPVME